MSAQPSLPDFALHAINLASPRLGAEVIFASDDFFADKARLIQDAPAVFIPDKFDDHGKWMDGWESKRRRRGGHDVCVLKLGVQGIIHGLDIDTSHFTGNYPPAASVDAALGDTPLTDNSVWHEILPATALGPNAHHFHPVNSPQSWSHVRLHIYPDGGVARLRVYGDPVAIWQDKDKSAVYELSALANGGRIIAYNDAHYGTPSAILAPGRGVNMADGWETRRRREPGNDWIIVKLGAPGIIERIEVDTCHYKGNYPDRCSVQASLVTAGTDRSIITQSMFWDELMGEKPLEMDRIHSFGVSDIRSLGPVSHVKLNIFPDGGISRFRIFGRPQ